MEQGKKGRSVQMVLRASSIGEKRPSGYRDPCGVKTLYFKVDRMGVLVVNGELVMGVLPRAVGAINCALRIDDLN